MKRKGREGLRGFDLRDGRGGNREDGDTVKKKVLLFWDGGKDCARVLLTLQQSDTYEAAGLFEMAGEQRNLQHGILHELIQAQADQAGLPLFRYIVPREIKDRARTREHYQELIRKDSGLLNKLAKIRESGVEYLASGNIYSGSVLESDEAFQAIGFKPLSPLVIPKPDHWESFITQEEYFDRICLKMAYEWLKTGLKAVVIKVSVSLNHDNAVNEGLHLKWIGREYDRKFLEDIQVLRDPWINACGENDEFHTFVYGGPIFKKEIVFRKGGIVYRDEMNFGRQCLLDIFPA